MGQYVIQAPSSTINKLNLHGYSARLFFYCIIIPKGLGLKPRRIPTKCCDAYEPNKKIEVNWPKIFPVGTNATQWLFWPKGRFS